MALHIPMGPHAWRRQPAADVHDPPDPARVRGRPQRGRALGGQDCKARAIAALSEAKPAGIDTILDATTFDLGRSAELPAAASKGSGVNIINVTGWWLDVPRFPAGEG